MISHAVMRTAFDNAAAFWRPWFRGPQEKNVATGEHAKSQEPAQSKNRGEQATEKRRKATKKRATGKPSTQEPKIEKKAKAPTKRSLKDEQELEREERAEKTARLRELRLAKEAANRKNNRSGNGLAIEE
jgi:hypothetical protein